MKQMNATGVHLLSNHSLRRREMFVFVVCLFMSYFLKHSNYRKLKFVMTADHNSCKPLKGVNGF